MSEVKLTQEQWEQANRAERALDDLYNWLEALNPETDAEVIRIVKLKIKQLFEKITRRFGSVSLNA